MKWLTINVRRIHPCQSQYAAGKYMHHVEADTDWLNLSHFRYGIKVMKCPPQ